MALKPYIYTGSRTSISLPPEKEGGEVIAISLIPGQPCELPDNLPYVKRLIKQKKLTAVIVAKTSTRRRATGGDE